MSFRERSEEELRSRLKGRFAQKEVEEAIARLKELSLIDDRAFAKNFVRSARPKGRRLLLRELLRKGVSLENALSALSDFDELEASLRAGRRRAEGMRGLPFEEFRRKIGRYLYGRGFPPDVIEEAVGRLWEEVNEK